MVSSFRVRFHNEMNEAMAHQLALHMATDGSRHTEAAVQAQQRLGMVEAELVQMQLDRDHQCKGRERVQSPIERRSRSPSSSSTSSGLQRSERRHRQR